MREIIILTIIILLSSCKKNNSSILNNSKFQELVGTWIPIAPDDDVEKIIISSEGKIEYFLSIGRGKHFKINTFRYNNNEIIYNNDTLQDYVLSREKNNKIIGMITFFKQPYSNKALLFGGYDVNNYVKDSTTGDYFIKL